ncbi:MAG: hypothetical protein LBT75_01705, partial [Bacilli bacterium]|nr:hypothetical protein [Bacilli bacterium]
MQNENGVDIGAVCAVPNICLSIFMIFYVEKFQHLFYYYKTRLVKNNQVYLKSFIGILKNSIFKFLLFILMYTIFFFITNKQVLLVYVLIYLFSLYIELLIIRNILIFFFKPRIISLILLVFFFMTWTINNFFPNNPLIPIVASFSPYSMFPFSLLKIRIIVYLVISILMYFVLTYLRQITKFIKKFNFNIFKLLVILSFFLLAFNIYTIGRIKDMEFYLFYSHELYQNLYEYMMFNFIIYFTINLKTGLFCFNMKSGMQRYFQYRIISR